MIYKMTLKDSADEMTFDLLEVPIVDKDIEGAVDNVTLDGNQYTDYLWLKKQFIQKWSILCDDEYTRLRGFYTRQFENADVPSYRLYYGEDIVRNFTESGEYISLSINGITDGTMSLTQMDGNIEQTTYAGKNLLNVEKTTQTVSGVTFTINADKTIIVNGTASALITFNLINTTFTLASGQYYLSGCPSGGNDSTYRLDINNGADGNQRDYGNGSAFTLSQSTTINNVRIRIASGATLNRLEFKPMINTGSTAQPYEPYVGGQPSPSPSYPQPIQTVTGRQTVTVTGENIWDSGLVIGGIGSDGSSLNRADRFNSASFVSVEPNTQYTFSAIPKTAGKTAQVFFLAYDSRQSYIKQLPSNAWYNLPLTITTDQDTRYLKISGRYTDNTTFGTVGNATDAIQNVQLEEGSTATAYEPYEGQNYEINLGKNLFDNSSVDIGHVWNGSINAKRAYGYIEAVQGQAYTVSADNQNSDLSIYVVETSAIGVAVNPIKQTTLTGKLTFVPQASTKYIVIQFATTTNNVAQTDVDNSKVQIEKGYTASSYSAYFDPIELCKIGTYQDRIYKENEKWWLRKEIGKVVLDGSENWTTRSGATAYAYSLADVFDGNNASGLSDHFRFIQGGASSGQSIECIASASTAKTLNVFTNEVSMDTLANFKTWLASNNVTVCYVLATPTTTEITNQEILEGLEALQDEAISVGLHNIYTDTPNALPTLTFDLTEYLSQSTTIIPETAVRLTLTDGGVINACGCRKDVQLTMRETIE